MSANSLANPVGLMKAEMNENDKERNVVDKNGGERYAQRNKLQIVRLLV